MAENKAANRETEATPTAAMPELTCVSAKLTRPLDSSTISKPRMMSVFHCLRVGAATPLNRISAYSTMPASAMRIAPRTNGG